MLTSRTRLVAVAAVLGVAGALAATTPAAGRSCAAHRGTIAKSDLGRVWHQGTSLYVCATEGKAASRRMGSWKPGTRMIFDGFSLVWTTPLTRNGERSDRLWAGSALTGRRWLAGSRAVPASGEDPAREARVQRLFLRDDSAAWVTRTSEVVLGVSSPEYQSPQPIGMQVGPLDPTGNLLLVGRFEQAAPDALAASLRLTAGQNEGDECDSVVPYELTVRPDLAEPQLGATWSGRIHADPETCNL